jgi:hypothetical protein
MKRDTRLESIAAILERMVLITYILRESNYGIFGQKDSPYDDVHRIW